MSKNRDYLHLHFIVFIWGFSAIIGLMISLPSVEVVFFRTAISALGLLILLLILKRNLQVQNVRVLLIYLGVGMLIAAHWITFFLSARMSNISVCLAGFATCALWTSFIEPLAYRTKMKSFEVGLSLIAFLGIGIIFGFDRSQTEAMLVSMLSALIAAIFSVINAKIIKDKDPVQLSFYEMLGACLSILIFVPFYESRTNTQFQFFPSTEDWLLLSILAIVCTVYAWTVSIEIMKRLSAFSVNLIVNLEPIYGIALALLIFGESEYMNSWFYLGMLLVLASVLAYPPLNKYYTKSGKDFQSDTN